MTLPTNLNLLMIDDNQLYAEQLVAILEQTAYKKVTLGFLDDQEELLKSLRQSWDVLVMGKAYDLTLPQVKAILTEQGLDLPIIAVLEGNKYVMESEHALNSHEASLLSLVTGGDATTDALPLYDYWGAVTVIPKSRLYEVAHTIAHEHQNLLDRRQLADLKRVLSDAEQRANILIKNSKSAVAYIDEGLHVYANDPYLHMFGYQSMEDIMGIPVVDLIASNNIKDFKAFLREFERGNRDNVEFKFESIKSDGTTFAAKLQLAAATYEGHPCLQVIIQPNEQGNNAELVKKLAQMERVDVLTGTANRRGFEEALVTVRETTIAQKNTSGLVYLRLDNIGKINASVGIQGVDATVLAITHLLQQRLAQLLGETAIPLGYLSRFSDTTFMVIAPNIAQVPLLAWAEAIRSEIADLLVEVGHRTVKTTVSIGITMLTSGSPSVEDLINRVMEAANTVRNDTNGDGNAIQLYDPSQYASSDDTALLEALQVALTQGKFELLYQPIYDVEQDVSNLFEVSVRLPLADGSLMGVEQFGNVAQKHQLMDKIDRWVLIRAAKTLKEYRQNDPNARLLVQLSAASLTDMTLAGFATQLNKAIGGTTPQVLTLQFSETLLADYMTVAIKQTEQLKSVGWGVGILNFGGAVNAVEMLTMVQPNLVRLDRSYVKDLANSDNVGTINALISQAKQQGIDVLMPYIEDAAAMSAAWTIGARYLQGNYLQAPAAQMQIQTDA